jgi:outer membrane protein TolC
MKSASLFTLVCILYTFNCFSLKAETYNLTLEESIELAKEKSYTMRMLVQDIRIAEYNLKSTTSRLKTHISMDLTVPDFSESVRQRSDTTGMFFRTKTLTYSGGLTINQPLPTDGSLYVQSGLATFKDFYNGTQSSNLNTRIGFRQPLDALYGYNSIKTALKNAQLAYERASKVLKRNELTLVSQVSQYYYNLLSFQKSAEIAQLNLDRQKEAYEISKNKYEAGLIREVDALQMEVDLAEAQSNYDMALFNQSSALNSFKELIGIELDDTVILSSELQYKVVIVDPEQAVRLALENRSELREREIDIELQKLDLKRQKAQGMVRGSLNAYVEKVGVDDPRTAYNQIANSIDNSYNSFKDSPYSYGIGFTISVPILDWGENRALVRASEARIRQSTLNKEDSQRNIETEVRNIVASISSNLKRLQLLEKNVAVAEKSFEITLQRFSDGDIDSQSLALERTRLNTAYTSHLGAYIGYQMTLTELMRATLYDFQTNEVIK